MDNLLIATEPAGGQVSDCTAKTLAPAKSICPCHPAEVRSERFAVLDSLIKAGRGSVPIEVIELEYKTSVGILLSEAPSFYQVFGSDLRTSLNSLVSR